MLNKECNSKVLEFRICFGILALWVGIGIITVVWAKPQETNRHNQQNDRCPHCPDNDRCRID